ncbi:MAG: hypothetical protein WDO16_15285 [Bacteroidota bacterium]
MSKEQDIKTRRKFPESLFYSNYFYGICAVALSVEATLQQHFPLNGFIYFFLAFVTTVLYYGYPYIRKYQAISSNPRTNWHTRHYQLMRCNQVIMTVILLLSLVLFLLYHWKEVLGMTPVQWSLVLIFPSVAALYYGIDFSTAGTT